MEEIADGIDGKSEDTSGDHEYVFSFHGNLLNTC